MSDRVTGRLQTEPIAASRGAWMRRVGGLHLTGPHYHGCSTILADGLAVQACLQEDPGVPQLVILGGDERRMATVSIPVSATM